MKQLGVFVAGLMILVLAIPALHAQQRQRGQRSGAGFGGGRDMVSLLTQKSVQEELKLTDDRVKKITDLAGTQRGGRQGQGQGLSQEERQKRQQERAQANEKALADILKPDQLKRAKQITWQQQGAQAFSDSEVMTALKLTDDQKAKIKTIQEDAQGQRGQFQRGGNPQEAQRQREALRKSTEEKVLALLTVEQRAKWKELTGEPFKGEIIRAGRGRNRGGAPPSQS